MAKQYITLKQAAEISGYSRDYVGQLIREGKIPGRQVYANVAWVTTKDAILQYKQKQNGGGSRSENIFSRTFNTMYELKNRLMLELRFTSILRWAFYLAIVLSIVLIVLLFYAFSVSFDKKLEEDALRQASPTPIESPEGEVIEGVPAL